LPRSMDNANEDFWLQISTDGGSSFATVGQAITIFIQRSLL